jgi:hypothetical protein
MVAGEKAVVISLQDSTKWPTKKERELIYDAWIIISDFSLIGSPLTKVLENYDGTYLNINKDTKKIGQNPTKLTETIIKIEKIRDALGNIDPQNKWIYYDNAGKYIHLLRDTYGKLNNRLGEYHKTSFVLVGENIDDFLNDFWLQKYAVWKIWNYKSSAELISILKKNQENSPITTIITEKNLPVQAVNALKKMNIVVYTLPDIQDDTSEWGYIRFIEKMVSTFVAAYDTYD